MKRGIAAVIGIVLVLIPVPALAHGIGGRSDLPVPVEYFVVGATVVLLLSFGALAVLWPKARLQDGPRYRGDGWRLPRWLAAVLATAGVLWLGAAIFAGLLGHGGVRDNLAPVSVWVVFWLVLPFGAAVLGNWWAVINPWATIGRLVRRQGPSGPGRLGVYPATVAFVAFVWLELVHAGSGDPATLGWAALAYTVYLALWAGATGVDRAIVSADAFTVYHRLLSSIAPFGRDGERIRWRGWLRALPVLPQWPGLSLFAVAMIGTVTYDGLGETLVWDDWTFGLVGIAQREPWFRTLSLLAVVAVIGLAYLTACWVAKRMARSPMTTGQVAASFAHTLVPIALAYAVAHYFTLVVFEGQLIIPVLSDPFGLGWDLFGTAGYTINYTWLSPTAVWWIQLITVVGGHVAGVALAHDRALAVFKGDRAVRSQYAMLALMVGLTALALTVLAVS